MMHGQPSIKIFLVLISNQNYSVKICSVLSEISYCTARRIVVVNLPWSSEVTRQMCNSVFRAH